MQDDRTQRQKTRHRGISYRESSDGRTYSVFFQGKYVSRDAAGNLLTKEGEALARQEELRGAKRKGEKPILATKKTFAELAESWLEGKQRVLGGRTADYYQDALDLVLIPRFGQRPISAVSADDIAALIRDLERDGLHAIDPKRPSRPLGRSSVSNYLKPLQGVLGLAVRRRLIGTNPFTHLLREERPKASEARPVHAWTEHELEALFAASERLYAAKTGSNRTDYTPLLRLAASTGLRQGELLGLQWQDFDSEAGRLHVRRQYLRSGEYGKPKTKAGVRSVPLTSDLKLLLLEVKLRSRFKGDDDPIFAGRDGKPFGHRNAAGRGFEAARDEAGLDESLTFHELRHAAASRLIAKGINPVAVASHLGHEDPHVTLKVYAHLFDRETQEEQIRKALEG